MTSPYDDGWLANLEPEPRLAQRWRGKKVARSTWKPAGQHVDRLIVDDPWAPQPAMTEAELEAVRDLFTTRIPHVTGYVPNSIVISPAVYERVSAWYAHRELRADRKARRKRRQRRRQLRGF